MAPLAKRQRPGSRERNNVEELAPAKISSAGDVLRDRREALGWELGDIAADLRIKPEYLTALENNDIAALPGQAYASGFLRTYADFLGLNGPKIVEQFKRQSDELRQRPALNFPMPMTEHGIPGGGLILIALIFLGIGYGAWIWYSSGPHLTTASVDPVPARLLAPTVEEPPSPPADTGAASPVASPTVAPGPTPTPITPAPATPTQGSAGPITATIQPALPTVSPTPPADPLATDPNAGPHVFGDAKTGTVLVKAVADTWVEVLDNNHSIWNRLLRAGDTYNPPKDGLVLRTGNAGGVQVTVNGKVLPPFGQSGEVKRIPLDADKLSGG